MFFTFSSKRYLWYLMFYIFFAKLFAISHFRTCAYDRLSWDVNKLIGTWYVYVHAVTIKLNSSAVESSLSNPWIGGSNHGETISISISRRMNPFSSENGPSCTEWQLIWCPCMHWTVYPYFKSTAIFMNETKGSK